jgi:hypothetical protein
LNKAVNPALILVFGELVPAIAERIRQTLLWRRRFSPAKPSIRIPLLCRDIVERCNSRGYHPAFEGLNHFDKV